MDENLPKDLGRRLGDLADLPEALRSQLQAAKMSQLEQNIIGVLRDQYDGAANVDEILVGLYRLTTTVHQRPYLSNKLYRMAQAGQIVSVPKRKGVYRTK